VPKGTNYNLSHLDSSMFHLLIKYKNQLSSPHLLLYCNLFLVSTQSFASSISYGYSSKIMKKKILVLCTGNSCRSQIAEAYLRHFFSDNAEIYSAGIETHGVNPRAIATMKENGIDISNHTSNHVDEFVIMPKKDVPFSRPRQNKYIKISRILLKQQELKRKF
jgi:hypothetical protein